MRGWSILAGVAAALFFVGCTTSSSSGGGGGGGGGVTITTTSLPDASEGTPYNTTVQASGGTTPYSWSCSGLPSGLSWQQSGDVLQITGTPATGSSGTYSVSVSVSDSSSPQQSDAKTLPLTVKTTSSGGGIDPSGGSGGSTQPGGIWDFAVAGAGSGHVYVYIPTSYDPQTAASPVVWLFNEEIDQWQAIADTNNIILVDLDEYNDTQAYLTKINTLIPELEDQYNVDRARYYFAGWSAGGNIAIMFTDDNQGVVAAAVVFPGSGGAAPAIPPERPNGAKYYYAVGDQDTATGYYPGCVNEANYRQGQGYTTRCDVVAGCGHYIDESTYHKRADAWAWVKDFNLQN